MDGPQQRARPDARNLAVRRRAAAARLRHERAAGPRRRDRPAEAARALGATASAQPRPARRSGRHAAALRAPRRDHAGDGVRRDSGRAAGGFRPRRSRARPRDHPRQHQSPRARADDHRPQLPREDQRQHRQLRRVVVDRGGGREAALGHAVGRRHGDGPVHRQEHPRDARVDRPQLRGADRHGADLPGARKGRRPPGRSHLGGVSRHPHRAVRTGRRLLHRARRRVASLHSDDRAPRHRHRVARRLDHGEMVSGPPSGELHLHALP